MDLFSLFYSFCSLSVAAVVAGKTEPTGNLNSHPICVCVCVCRGRSKGSLLGYLKFHFLQNSCWVVKQVGIYHSLSSTIKPPPITA